MRGAERDAPQAWKFAGEDRAESGQLGSKKRIDGGVSPANPHAVKEDHQDTHQPPRRPLPPALSLEWCCVVSDILCPPFFNRGEIIPENSFEYAVETLRSVKLLEDPERLFLTIFLNEVVHGVA